MLGPKALGVVRRSCVVCWSTGLGYLFEGGCCCASHMFVFWTLFCALLDNVGFVGFLCVFFCWAIAGCEYSFLLIFGFVCTFLGGRGGLGVYSFW